MDIMSLKREGCFGKRPVVLSIRARTVTVLPIFKIEQGRVHEKRQRKCGEMKDRYVGMEVKVCKLKKN